MNLTCNPNLVKTPFVGKRNFCVDSDIICKTGMIYLPYTTALKLLWRKYLQIKMQNFLKYPMAFISIVLKYLY